MKEGKKITGPEQLKDAAFGCARIRGDTLGIVGLGKLNGQTCTPIYGLRTFCGEGSVNLYWALTIFGFNSSIL